MVIAVSSSGEAADAEILQLKAELGRLKAKYEQLRESEKMYRFSAEISNRLVWSTDTKGRLLSISRIFATITGTPENRVIEGGWLQAVHPEDRQRVEAEWRRCLKTGDPFDMEHRAILAGNIPRLVHTQAIPIREKKNGRILHWIASSMDIQDEREMELARREFEEKLRESEELYRYSVELSRQIVWKADTSGAMLYLSERFSEVLGENVEAGYGHGWRGFLHPEDRERVVGSLHQGLAGGSRFYIEFRLRVADGTYRCFCCRAAPRREADGTIDSWYGSIEDINERKRAEMARREAEERYRLAAMATNEAIWDSDLLTGEVEWSEAAAEILGWPGLKATTSWTWWAERIHPEDKIRVLESREKALSSSATRWSATYRFLREDGSYADVLDRGFIIRSDGSRAVRTVGATVDLTERHRAEAELKRIQAELVHVSRVSAMGTMASTLAHELNQPLTAVSNYIGGIRRMVRRSTVDPALFSALEAAESGALRAGQIVRRLREMVSRGRVTVAVEHLPKLIEEANVLAFLDAKLHDIRHRVELDPAARWVCADRIQIQQVLINLIRNAVEVIEDSSVREVVVSTSLHADDMIMISVADTGPGIPPENMETLFSRFMTTKKDGMGIGLPISRTIIEAHGGQIWAENREEGGAVFRFTLPRGKR